MPDIMQSTQKCKGLSLFLCRQELLHLSYFSPSLTWAVVFYCPPSPVGCGSACFPRAPGPGLETWEPWGERGQGMETALESTCDLTRERRKPCLVSNEYLNCLITSFIEKNTSWSQMLYLNCVAANSMTVTWKQIFLLFSFPPVMSRNSLWMKTEFEESFLLPVKATMWTR